MSRRSFPRKGESVLGPRIRGDEEPALGFCRAKNSPARMNGPAHRTVRRHKHNSGYALTALPFNDLAANLAALVGVGVDIGVPQALLQIGGLSVRQCRRALEGA